MTLYVPIGEAPRPILIRLIPDAVYPDFAEELHSFIPPELLLKLEVYRIDGQSVEELSRFLTSEMQCVIIDY